MSAPLVATWLRDQVLQPQSRLAPMIANMFSPLLRFITLAYLLILLNRQRSLFEDH